MLLSVHVTSVLFLVLAGKFHPDYGLLLELHALTLVARSYALLFPCIKLYSNMVGQVLVYGCVQF